MHFYACTQPMAADGDMGEIGTFVSLLDEVLRHCLLLISYS